MYKKSAILTFYAETPIHMGAGQSVSYVDLPVQRERHTSFPVLWSSGIKGVIRDMAMRYWESEYRKHGKTPEEAHKLAKDKVETIFGPEDGSSDFASCISITDAKILLYPVRSVKGVFAWITCPFVLKRFREDLEAIIQNNSNSNSNENQVLDNLLEDLKSFLENDNLKDTEIRISNSSKLEIKNQNNQNNVALEEFVFEVDESQKQKVESLANSLKSILPDNPLTQSLVNHLAIVSDNVFRDFVNYAVEIRTRIKIDQALGTVKKGALFSEELIPSESVFYSLIFITDPYFGIEKDLYNDLKSKKENNETPNWDDVKNRLKGNEDTKEKILERLKNAWNNGYFVDDEVKNSLNFLNNFLLQLGGDETTGKGYVRVKFNEGNKQS
jgi:CRISPR-associated protein Cmr4